RRGCTEGTRIGVLNGLDDWLYNSASPSIYWMNGMAGMGKTTIASTFCERVERRKLLAASFFCTRNSVECRDVTRIVPTILYQLAQYSTPFQLALCKILEQNSGIRLGNMQRQFEQLLKEPLQEVKDAIPDKLVVMIDALDECDDRHGTEPVLDMLFNYAAHVPLKFLVTSRPESEIYGKMSAHTQSQATIHLHDIENSLVQSDIQQYLKEELSTVFPGEVEVEQLAQHSGTLFIYAATLVRYIICKDRESLMLQAVLNMAPGSIKKHAQIDALYEAVLNAALTEDQLDATGDIWIVLCIVLLAQEPISTETIAKLADIDNPLHVALAVQPLRSVLHQLEKTGLVSAPHASFTDFMFNNERSRAHFCDVAKHSQGLAQRCFFLMKEQLRFNICGLQGSYLPDEKVVSIQERIKANISPTLAYASRYWASHLALATGWDILLEMLQEFLCH
ncbi:vegetative incompatibility protein HET-E-1, partial [Rhizoctonia solani 123E]